ncbi:MAG: 4Fe-4S binding protein [Deltaproteobacteria bacterium]|nr:MAG: 4Fe-4S binding protein [Deltaproteobacteria bacterium]
MEKFTIRVNPGSCTGCLLCQLACSEHYTGSFNPSAARVQVDVSGIDCSIRFTEECNGCGVCVDYCFYEALRKEAVG